MHEVALRAGEQLTIIQDKMMNQEENQSVTQDDLLTNGVFLRNGAFAMREGAGERFFVRQLNERK